MSLPLAPTATAPRAAGAPTRPKRRSNLFTVRAGISRRTYWVLALTGLFTFDDASADVDAVMMSIEDARQENIIRQQGREAAAAIGEGAIAGQDDMGGRVDPGGATLRALQARDPYPNQSLASDAAKGGVGGKAAGEGGGGRFV